MSNQFPLSIQTQPVPDSTYFRTSDVAPVIEDGSLVITDGSGSRRSWGSPSCDTKVYQVDGDIIAVHVTGWHKHTVSPVGGWFYFLRSGDSWRRVTANKKEIKAIRDLLPEYGRFTGEVPANITKIH